MNDADRPPTDASNPFSTSRVRPGAIDYLFPDGQNADLLARRLRDSGWLGQIVGPHGSGKSTLLAALMPAVERLGRRVLLVELHDGQRRLPGQIADRLFLLASSEQERTLSDADVLIIDGYEQLPWWRRRKIERQCRRLGVGLLATAHRSVGLPDVARVEVDPERSRQIVAGLLDGWPERIVDAEVAECVRRHGQNLREALFELYDRFEQHRRQDR